MLIILCKTYFETTYYYLFCHFKDHTRNKITVLAKEVIHVLSTGSIIKFAFHNNSGKSLIHV